MKRSQFLRAAGAFAAVSAGLSLAGCGGGSGGDAEPAPAPTPAPPPTPPAQVRTFVYVANNASSNISVFEVASTGRLESKGAVLAEGVRAVAIHPSGRFAHVTQDSGVISVFSVDPRTGMLTSTPSVAAIGAPSKLVFHPSGKFAYLPDFDTVITYAVDAGTGALNSPEPLVLPDEQVSGIAVDPAGRFVYVTSTAGTVASFSVDVDSGTLAFRSSAPTGALPQEIVVAPSGRFLFAERGSAISAHIIDASGQLGDANSVAAKNIAHIAVEPSERFLYALTGVVNANFVSTFSIGSSGELELKGETPTVATFERQRLAISSSGRFLYVMHLEVNAVHAFEINQDTGALTELTPSFETGNEPVDITIADIPQ